MYKALLIKDKCRILYLFMLNFTFQILSHFLSPWIYFTWHCAIHYILSLGFVFSYLIDMSSMVSSLFGISPGLNIPCLISTFVKQHWLQFIRICIKCLSIKYPYILLYFAPSHFTTSLVKITKKHYVTNEILNFLSSYLTQQQLNFRVDHSHFFESLSLLAWQAHTFFWIFLWNLKVHHGLVFMGEKKKSEKEWIYGSFYFHS